MRPSSRRTVVAGCVAGGDDDGQAGGEPTQATTAAGGDASIGTGAFANGDTIPERFTCEGENVSPPLSTAGDDAASLALVVDDPDAPGGTFTHWLLWGLPASSTRIPAGVDQGETVPDLGGAAQGTNDAGVVGYSGPCPPRGDGPHTYRFRLLALTGEPALQPGADRRAVDDAVAGLVATEAVLTGAFGR